MNKRIEELAEECTEYFPGDDVHETKFHYNKFAELIIKECAHIAWLNSTEDNISHIKIKDHFGIKE